jgi:hypothetical protein
MNFISTRILSFGDGARHGAASPHRIRNVCQFVTAAGDMIISRLSALHEPERSRSINHGLSLAIIAVLFAAIYQATCRMSRSPGATCGWVRSSQRCCSTLVSTASAFISARHPPPRCTGRPGRSCVLLLWVYFAAIIFFLRRRDYAGLCPAIRAQDRGVAALPIRIQTITTRSKAGQAFEKASVHRQIRAVRRFVEKEIAVKTPLVEKDAARRLPRSSPDAFYSGRMTMNGGINGPTDFESADGE